MLTDLAHRRVFLAACAALAGQLAAAVIAGEPGAASLVAGGVGGVGMALVSGWQKRGKRRVRRARVMGAVFERWRPQRNRQTMDKRTDKPDKEPTMQQWRPLVDPKLARVNEIVAANDAMQAMHRTGMNQTSDYKRVVYEAKLVNQLLKARKLSKEKDVFIPANDRRQPSHYITPSTIVYDLAVPMDVSGEKLVSQQDDILAYIRQFRRMNGIRNVDHSGMEAMPTVRVDRYDHTVEISRPQPEMLAWDAVQWEPRPMTALCGLRYGHDGATPVLWDLSRPDQPHGLVAGTTGSGKTNALLAILYSLMLHNSPETLQITVADPKHSDGMQYLDDLPHVRRVARDLSDVIHAVEKFHQEMMHRERGDIPRDIRHVLAVEECASLTEHPDKEMRNRALYWLADIARRSRENNMNLIICTQKPTADVLGDQLKSNLPLRLVGAVNSKDDALVALNVKQSGAEALPGYGAFIYRLNRTMHRIQTPFVDHPVGLCRQIQKWCNESYTLHRSAPPLHHPAPVRTGASEHDDRTRVENTDGFAPVQFPLIEKRPLTDAEAERVRYLSGQMSKNRLCVHVYGAKSPRYMAWIDEALSTEE